MRIRYALIALMSGCSGCAAMPAIEAAGSGLSALGAYFSYKALQQDPVEVTTISKECTFIRYISIPCEERAGLSPETKQAIADQNRRAVELCGIEKASTQCQ